MAGGPAAATGSDVESDAVVGALIARVGLHTLLDEGPRAFALRFLPDFQEFMADHPIATQIVKAIYNKYHGG